MIINSGMVAILFACSGKPLKETDSFIALKLAKILNNTTKEQLMIVKQPKPVTPLKIHEFKVVMGNRFLIEGIKKHAQ